MNSPWMTRKEAAEYLRCSVDTIDRISVEWAKERQAGKIRYALMESPGEVRKVRLLASDVRALLPEVEEAA